MTMKELARLANVSVSTVSKAFGDAKDISADTKAHIFAIAKEQGCFGKFYREKYEKKVIALICPEIAGNYYSIFVNRLQELIESAGGICILSTDGFSSSRQAELIEYYASYLKVDGLIVFGLSSRLKKGYEIPIVSLFSTTDAAVDSVNVDMGSAIGEAVDTLYSMGHRQIAFLGEQLTRAKAEAFADAMAKKELPPTAILESTLRFEQAGAQTAAQLLDSGHPFTALICAYDHIAFGAMKTLRSAGLSIPEEVSVIGIDNIAMGEYSEIPLTSIDTQPEDICRIAWDLLERKFESKYYRAMQSIIIRPRLVLRKSIAQASSNTL